MEFKQSWSKDAGLQVENGSFHDSQFKEKAAESKTLARFPKRLGVSRRV